jgi:hypothetical protein
VIVHSSMPFVGAGESTRAFSELPSDATLTKTRRLPNQRRLRIHSGYCNWTELTGSGLILPALHLRRVREAGIESNFVCQLPHCRREPPTFRPRATATVCATREDIMRFIVASFLVLSSFHALNAEPLTPMPIQNRPACSASQLSVLQTCRDRCDDTEPACNSKCKGQSDPYCTRQCMTTRATCRITCLKSSGC